MTTENGTVLNLLAQGQESQALQALQNEFFTLGTCDFPEDPQEVWGRIESDADFKAMFHGDASWNQTGPVLLLFGCDAKQDWVQVPCCLWWREGDDFAFVADLTN